MKKISVLARKEDQDKLLQAIQSLKNIETIDIKSKLSDELLSEFEVKYSDKKIRELSTQLDQINEQIEYLTHYVKPQSLFEKLASKRQVFTLAELKQRVDRMDLKVLLDLVKLQRQKIDNYTKELENNEDEETFLRSWNKLELLPEDAKRLEYMTVKIGSIETKVSDSFKEDIDNLQAVIEEIYYSDEISHFMVTVAKDHEIQLMEILDKYNFKLLEYPYQELPKEKIKEVMDQRQRIINQRQSELNQLRYQDEVLWNLKLAKEYIYNVRERENAREMILNTANLFLLKGWIPEPELDEEIIELKKALEDQPIAILTEDVEVEDEKDVPIILDNAHIVGPFETITEQYSMPKYRETDPTPYFYPFHILFFGIMTADLGYGLLLWLMTFIPLKIMDLSPKMRNNLRFFNQMSYGTIAAGLFFGSCFGFNLPFKVWDVTGNIIELLVLSVTLGIIHLFVGYLLKASVAYKEKDWKSFYLDAVQWMLILVGIVILGVNVAFLGNNPLYQTIGIWLIIGNIIGMVLVNTLAHHNKMIGFGQGIFGIIGATGFMGDLISYTRLAALAVSGANIGMAFNMIIGLLPPVFRFTVGVFLFLVLHGLNIFLSFLGAYVHNMRLEYVEFFGKFYEGGGKKFTPLKPLEENIEIKKEN